MNPSYDGHKLTEPINLIRFAWEARAEGMINIDRNQFCPCVAGKLTKQGQDILFHDDP